MAEGVLFNVAEGIIGRLQSLIGEEIGLIWGAEDELRKLAKSVTKIKAVLLDAEEKKAIDDEVKEWLKSLEDVVYDADDLVDEFYTKAQWREVQAAGNKMSNKVRLFFLCSNPLVFRGKIGHKVRKIRETLNGIANSRRFHLDERLEETRVFIKERETHSFVRKDEIIGRDKDKEAIMKLLLGSSMSKDNVSVISIVGIGGLGKTALAQFIFNDEKVQKHFELKIWICVSDEFELNILVKKIIESVTNETVGNLAMDILENKLRILIDGKRYLLVLDDVWEKNRDKWLKLKNLLMGGARGSSILLTTRLKEVASLTDTTGNPLFLNGLDDNQSWSLFKQMAFRDGKEPEDLRVIGIEIVGKCKGVPLAIRTIGRILYSKQGVTEWLAFKNKDFSKVSQEETEILPTLKLSYDVLPSHLKHCFAYCRLFPKDYEIDLKTLVNLWVAQGFVESLHQNESLEDVGREYFKELLWRSFFQEEKYDELGMIRSCKIHDLMHELAISVSGKEIAIVDPNRMDFSENLRHVSFGDPTFEFSRKLPASILKENKMRTWYCFYKPYYRFNDEQSSELFCNAIASNFKSLRVLSLNLLNIETLPKCLSKMIHLRYLDLSVNKIKRLPKWIVRLQNLQVLNLSGCSNLVELPRDINKLFNLRHLMVFGCDSLTHMPIGLSELTCLRTLDRLVLGKDKYMSVSNAGLGVLNRLNELMGTISVEGLRDTTDMVLEAKSANMKEKHHLSSLDLKWEIKDTCDVNENGEMVLQALQPHSNLKELSVWYYDGARFADWLSSLTNVVKLYLDGCKRCQYLPPIDHLPCLKSLGIEGFHALEYISDSSPPALGIPFFPSLKKLCLRECPNLKGWWKPDALNGPSMIEDEQQHLSFPSFPCLSLLDIFYCPNLTSMPLYPHLEERLVLWYTSLKPLEQTMITENDDTLATTEVAPSPPASKCCSSLFFLLPQFLSGASNSHVPSSSSPPLSKLLFLLILDIEDIVCVPEIWLRNLTSLKKLHILRCPKLKSIPLSPSPSIQHLTTLEDLWIDECNALDLWKDENFLQWASLKNLRRLTISNCDRLIKLPDGIGNLTSLEELSLFYCSGLESLPEWMCRLTSLKTLEIHSCSDVLHQRCKKEIGEDWSKIAHIQNVFIYPPAE